MIASFGDPVTEDLFHGRSTARVRRVPAEIAPIVLRKLDQINAADRLQDLATPPGNRLEAMRGAWRGRHSIRVNDQWRLVFRWQEGQAFEVRLLDYHS